MLLKIFCTLTFHLFSSCLIHFSDRSYTTFTFFHHVILSSSITNTLVLSFVFSFSFAVSIMTLHVSSWYLLSSSVFQRALEQRKISPSVTFRWLLIFFSAFSARTAQPEPQSTQHHRVTCWLWRRSDVRGEKKTVLVLHMVWSHVLLPTNLFNSQCLNVMS